MKTVDYRTVAGMVCLALSVAANARETSPAQKVAFDITAPSMTQALMQFTEQSGLQLAFPMDGSTDRPARRVVGAYTATAALEALLADSGLRYEFANDRTISIHTIDAAPVADAGNIRLADAAGEPSSRLIAIADRDPGSSTRAEMEAAPEDGRKAIPEILVRGGRTLNMDIRRTQDDAQPYIVFDRAMIEQSGASGVDEFLRNRLSAANTSISPSQSVGSGSNVSSIDLRGLGSGQTLVLIDGRRAAPRNGFGSTSQADINGIPLNAIERIEVLPATASGIYGGGATGGVINVVLRRDYTGIETSLTYGDSFDGGGGNRRVDLAGGYMLEGGDTSFTFSGTYSDATALYWGDRDMLERARARQLANNPSSILNALAPPTGRTTNIRSSNGAPLSLKPQYGGTPLNSAITSVPYGYQGPGADNGAGLIANAGKYNLDSALTDQSPGSAGQSLLSTPTIKSVSGTVRHRFTPWLDSFVELSASENYAISDTNNLTGQFSLAQNAPGNPFNQAIIVRTPALGTDLSTSDEERSYRGVLGFIVDLPASWRAETDYTYSRSRSEVTFADASLTAAASTAVSNGTTATGDAFNVFRDVNAFPLTFGSYLSPTTQRTPLRLTFDDVAVRLGGPLGFSLPAGAPTVSALLEHRKEALGDVRSTLPSLTTTTAYARQQTIDSIYLETLIPLVSTANRVPGVRLLELQLAARRDEYDVTGANSASAGPTATPAAASRVTRNLSSVDPTFSLRYQPVEDVTLRGSYGTGFLPPAMNQLVPNPPQPVSAPLTDPRRGNQVIPAPFTLNGGGNPNLRPEESKSWSTGLVFKPRFAPGLRTSVDWVKIDKRDNIQIFGLSQFYINLEQSIPGYVTRGPASDGFDVGPIISVNGQPMNIARQKVEAVDFATDYRLETAEWGSFAVAVNATRNLHNVSQVTATSAEVETVNLLTALPWKGNLDLMWERQEWTVHWTSRYFHSYCLLQSCVTGDVTLSQGSTTVPSQVYHDLSLSYRFAGNGGFGVLDDTNVRFGVNNVFNKKPPVDLSITNLYSTYGDPRLANYFLSITKSFGK